MYWNSRRIPVAILVVAAFLGVVPSLKAQEALSGAHPRPAITILDSTKEQDGLAGPVRRIKIESAKIEIKQGQPVEGPLRLLEITTYGLKGNRTENTSYPLNDSLIGKEEYKYDDRGNIIEMIVRDEHGAIITREAYTYEFDKLGNWNKMATSLLVFEDGVVKREPIEVTYRTLTYYFDDSISRIVNDPNPQKTLILPAPTELQLGAVDTIRVDFNTNSAAYVSPTLSISAGDPPPLIAKRPQAQKRSRVPITENKEIDNASKASSSAGPSTRPATANAEGESPVSTSTMGTDESNTGEKVVTPASVASAATESAPGKEKPPSEALDQKSALEYYKTGRERFESGDLKGAIGAYLESIKFEPKSAEVHLSLGQAYLGSKKDKEAAKEFKESVRLNPKGEEAAYGFGLASYRMGRFKDAADGFKKATTLSPKMAKAHYGLSLAYQELGNQTGLIEEFRILETLDRGLAKKLIDTFPQVDFFRYRH